VAGRSLDAAPSRSERDVVEVHLEDLVLAERRFDLLGHADLEELAAERALAAGKVLGEHVARELRGERAGALRGVGGAQVLPERPEDAAEVDGPVLAEAPVLDGHERLRHVPGKGGQADHRALDGGEVADAPSLAVEDYRAAARLVRGQLAHVRAALEEA